LFLFHAILYAGVVLALFLCVKLFDVYVDKTRPMLADAESEQLTMRTFNYYPYTENHIQPYFHAKGRELWTDFYKDFDVQSGDHGFFVAFDVDRPPKKEPNEIRIILTGGSAAQGWGGRTNADMFYRKLETALNDQLKIDRKQLKVTLINLAMAGSQSYQNYIALNKWGHKLEPDLILSFSGHNDLAVPFTTYTDATGSNYGGLNAMRRYADSPRWLKRLGHIFPGIVKKTSFGEIVRLYYFGEYQTDWNIAYLLSHYDSNYGPLPRAEAQRHYQEQITAKHNTLYETVIPLYVHSLQSMKRDFMGIPLVIAFQPLNVPDHHYEIMVKRVTEELTGYMNDKTYIFDLYANWKENNFYPGSLIDSVHLSNEGHELVTEKLKKLLYPIVRGLPKKH
jgi:hypothetical protein